MSPTFPEHPGTIVYVDLHSGRRHESDVRGAPDSQRYVYFENGNMTDDASRATERVPVVLVERMTLDKSGNLVDAGEATEMRVHEFGENRRLLRSTLMVMRP